MLIKNLAVWHYNQILNVQHQSYKLRLDLLCK